MFARDSTSVNNHCCCRAHSGGTGIRPEGNGFGCGFGLAIVYFDHSMWVPGPALDHDHCGSGDVRCSVDIAGCRLPGSVHALATAFGRF